MKNIRFLLISALAVILLLGGCAMETDDSATASSSTSGTNTEDNYPSEMPYEWIGFYSDSMADFIEWIESDGTKEVGMNGELEYPANRQFIEWAKNRKDITFPVMKNKEFHMSGVRVVPDSIAYSFAYTNYQTDMKAPETSQTFSVMFIYRTEEQRNKGIPSMITNDSIQENLNKGEKDCPWGEYWYTNYVDKRGDDASYTATFFLYDEYLVRITPYGSMQKSPWNPEWFELFDFETVSLK